MRKILSSVCFTAILAAELVVFTDVALAEAVIQDMETTQGQVAAAVSYYTTLTADELKKINRKVKKLKADNSELVNSNQLLKASLDQKETAILNNESMIRTLEANLRQARREEGSGSERVMEMEAQITDLKARVVNLLADRNAEYKRLITEFRDGVTQLAATDEGVDILASRGVGTLERSREQLDDLIRRRFQESNDKAQYVADLKALSLLAEDDRGRGEATTDELVARYEQITREAPDDGDAWLKLAEFYRELGLLDEAVNAGDKAAQTASNDWDKAAAYLKTAKAAADGGDYPAMVDAAEKAVAIRETLKNKDDPASTRNLVQTLSYLAQAQLNDAQDIKGARSTLDKALNISNEMVEAHPELPSLRHDRYSILLGLWSLSLQAGDLDKADELSDLATADIESLLLDSPASEGLLTDHFGLLKTKRVPDYTAAQIEHFESMVKIAKRRLTLAPDKAGYKADLRWAEGMLSGVNAANSGDSDAGFEALDDILKSEEDRTGTKIELPTILQDAQKLAKGEAVSPIDPPTSPKELHDAMVRTLMSQGRNPAQAEKTFNSLLDAAEAHAGEAFYRPDWSKRVNDVFDNLFAMAMSQGKTTEGLSYNEQRITYLKQVDEKFPGDRGVTKDLANAEKMAAQYKSMMPR